MQHIRGDAGATGKRRPFRLVALGAAAALLVPLIGSAGVGLPTAAAAPGDQYTDPTTNQTYTLADPVVEYSEDFQNPAVTIPTAVNSYTSTDIVTNPDGTKSTVAYTADPAWLPGWNGCNGWVMNSTSTNPASDAGCGTTGGAVGGNAASKGAITANKTATSTAAGTVNTAWWFLQQMALALGTEEVTNNALDPGITLATVNSNNAVSSQTNNSTKGQTAGEQFATAGTPVSGQPGHYYEVSAWFAESHCQRVDATKAWLDAQEELSLLVNTPTGVQSVVLTPSSGAYNGLDPCTGEVTNATNLQATSATTYPYTTTTSDKTPIYVSNLISSAQLLTQAQGLGLQLVNNTATNAANDVAFDLPQIIDVTPQMYKTFGASQVEVGVPVPLTFTIVNTSEEGAKDGWSFTDTLAPGLSVVSDTPVYDDCNDTSYAQNPTSTVNSQANADGTTTLKVTGDLAAGIKGCSITVDVVSNTIPENGKYSNGPSNISGDACVPAPGYTPTSDDPTPEDLADPTKYTCAADGLEPPETSTEVTILPPTLTLDKTITSIDFPAGTTGNDNNAVIADDKKSASNLKAGDEVTYSYQVTNTSAVPIVNVNALEADPPGTTSPIEYPYNGTLPNGNTSTGTATAEDLGATFNGSHTVPVVGNCTYDQASSSEDATPHNAGDPVDNGSIELAPKESATCTAIYVVTQTDVDNFAANKATGNEPEGKGLINTAVAIGSNAYAVDPTQQSSSDTSTATLTFDTTAKLDVTKTPTPQTMSAPGDVNWTITATNSGKVTLSDATVADDGMSNGGDVSVHDCYLNNDTTNTFNNDGTESLAPGDVVTCTATYPMTQDDIDAGTQLTNSASAKGTDPAGADIKTTSDPAVIDVQGMSLTKVISSVSRKGSDATQAADNPVTIGTDADGNSLASGLIAGDTVTYQLTMTNVGSLALNKATIDDSSFNGVDDAGDPVTLSVDYTQCSVKGTSAGVNLAPKGQTGDSTTCTVAYTVSQTDVNNYVANNATGEEPEGSGIINTAFATAQTAETTPTTVKTDPATATVIPTISDGLTITKIITGTVLPDNSPGPAPSADGKTVTVAQAGTTVNYSIVATNTGQTTLTVKVWDPAIPGAQNTDNNDDTTTPLDGCTVGGVSKPYAADPSLILGGYALQPGQQVICTASYTVIAADLTGPSLSGGQPLVNTAYVSGIDPAGNILGTDTDPIKDDATIQVASLVLQKTATNADGSPITQTTGISQDQQIIYHFALTNQGTVQITNASIADTDFSGAGKLSDITCPTWPSGTPGTINPGDEVDCTASYTVQPADLSGTPPNQTPITNTAVATGTDPSGDTVTSDPAQASTPLDAAPALSLEKTVSLDPSTPGAKGVVPTVTYVGQPIYYTLTATNTGNITLHSVDLTDNGVANAISASAGPLLVSNCKVYTSASGSGTPTPDGSISLDPISLNPNDYVTCTANYTTTQADMTAGGQLINSAEVTGLDLSGSPVGPEYATAPVNVASLSLQKSAAYADGTDTSSPLVAGEVVDYSFLVTNTGNVPLSDISIDDSGAYTDDTSVGFSGNATNLSAITCPDTSAATGTPLAPGASTTCTATYTLTQQDQDSGVLNNAATAKGTTPDQLTTTSDVSAADLPFTTTSGLTLDKTITSVVLPGGSNDPAATGVGTNAVTGGTVGDTVTYQFVVSNTGTVTEHQVNLAETKFTGHGTPAPSVGNCSYADTNQTDKGTADPTNMTLAPTETATCTATYVLTQDDINTGTVANAATATGLDPQNNPVTPAEASATITINPIPVVTLDKTVSAVTPISGAPSDDQASGIGTNAASVTDAQVGDQVVYQFVVTNTGNVTLTDVNVTDAWTTDTPNLAGTGTAPSVSSCTYSSGNQTNTGTADVGNVTLDPTETVTCVTAPYTLTQADINQGEVGDTATAHGMAPQATAATESDPSPATVTLPASPSISLVKTATPDDKLVVDQTVVYSFAVTNTGNVTMSNVTIDDGTNPWTDKRTPGFSGTLTDLGPITCTLDDDPATPATVYQNDGSMSLAPGESATCTADYTVQQSDVDAGMLSNTATANGKAPGATTTTPSNSSFVQVPQTGTTGLTLDKTITSVTLAADGSADPAATDVGTNAVTGGTVGDTVTYQFVVSNSGTVTEHGVNVAETTFDGHGTPAPQVGSCKYGDNNKTNTGSADATNMTLAPTETATCTATYVLTQDDINAGSVDNTATANGFDPQDNPVTPAEASATITIPSAPALTLTKTPGTQTVSTAGPVTWTVTTTNTGNVTLSGVKVTDPSMSPAGAVTLSDCYLNGDDTNTADPADGSITLAPTDTVTCTATYTMTTDDLTGGAALTNTATATGTPPSGTARTATDTATLEVSSLTLTKTITNVYQPSSTTPDSAITGLPATSVSGVPADDIVEYTFAVTNTGSVDVNTVTLAEQMTGVTLTGCSWATLAPTQTATCTGTYTMTQDDVDAGKTLTNTATASGTDTAGNTVDSNQAQAEVTPVNTPAITMTKTITAVNLSNDTDADTAVTGVPGASVSNVQVGDVVHYTLTAYNNGTVTMNEVTVTETAFTGSGTAPVASTSCNYGADASGDAVTNGQIKLAPGDSAVCTATYQVTQTDVDNYAASSSTKAVDNTATATGTPATSDKPMTSDPSKATVTPPKPTTSLALTKTADDAAMTGNDGVNDPVTYTFTVTNNSNVTLSNINVVEDGTAPVWNTSDPTSDALGFSGKGTAPTITGCTYSADNGPATNGAITLLPNESATCTATYDVVQNDVNAGQIVNVAQATGDDPSNTSVPSNMDGVVVPLNQTPELTLAKSASPTTVDNAGDKVTYSFTMTNTGNVTLNNVNVVDGANDTPLASVDASTGGFDAPGFSGTLPMGAVGGCQLTPDGSTTATSVGYPVPTLNPGDVVTCTAAYTVTQADVDAGTVVNTAKATSTGPDGTTTVASNLSTATVTATPAPVLTLTKTATAGPKDADGYPTVSADKDQISYTFAVQNTGNVTLSDLAIDETQFTGLGTLNDDLACAPYALGASLAPGNITYCTATYTVTQADIDAGGPINNTAVATGMAPGVTDPTAATSSDPSSAQVDVTQTPKLTLVKSASPSDAASFKLGQVVTYSFLVTNTGNVTINNLAIDDGGAYKDETTPGFSGSGSLVGMNCPATTLVPQGDPAKPADGSSTTCTATYTVTQADINAGGINNTATATGTGPQGPVTSDPDTATVPAAQDPEVSLTKQIVAPTKPVKAGDLLTFDFTVLNSGNVSLDGDTLAFTDSLPLASEVTCPASGQSWPNTTDHVLDPGKSVTCSATYELTQPDIDNGFVNNEQATVTVNQVNSDTTVSDQSSDKVTFTSNASLELVKDSTSKPEMPGDKIDYTFQVTNDGDVTIDGLAIAETKFTGTNGAPTITSCAYATDPTTPVAPADVKLAPNAVATCTATYTVTQDDVDAGIVDNTATVTGTSEGATPATVTSDPSTAEVKIDSHPALTLTKSASPTAGLLLGDTVTYSFAVTNTGNVTVHGIDILDPNTNTTPDAGTPGFSGTGTMSAISCPATSLASGASTTCTATYKVTQGDMDAGHIDNTAQATGFSPANTATPDVTSKPSQANVTTAQNPDINLQKTNVTLTGTPHVGDTVTYKFHVTNNGNVTLTGVGVTDPLPGLGAITCTNWPTSTVGTLAPGKTVDCTADYKLTQADINAGQVDNTATANGTSLLGTDVTKDDSDTVALPADPELTVAKVADPTTISKTGDVVTYTITVANTGNVTLDPLVVTDPGPVGGTGTMTDVKCDDSKLVPSGAETELDGVSVTTCTATYTATQADIDADTTLTNTVTATGTAPDKTTVTATDSADVNVTLNPSIQLTKGADVPSVSAPGYVHYTFTVTNNGNTTLKDVNITDLGPAAGDGTMSAVTCTPTTLVPQGTETETGGQSSTTCHASYLVTQDDIDAGADLINTATAHGTPVSGGTPVDSTPAQAKVTVDQTPALTVVKSVEPSGAMPAVGDDVTYHFVVTNSGNVTIDNVAIAETAFSGTDTAPTATCDVTTLAPTKQAICTATYTITQADWDAKKLTNTADATGTDPNGGAVTSDTSDASIPSEQKTSVGLVKSHELPVMEPAAEGQVVTFDFAVTNTGNVTLDTTTLQIADTMTGLSDVTCPATPATLIPGQTITCKATYTLTQTDVDNMSVTNPSAIATIKDVNGTLATSDPARDTVKLVGSTGLTLSKTVSPDTATAKGDTVTYSFDVTNTGTYTVTNLVINDAPFSGSAGIGTIKCDATTLAPQATTTCTVDYALTQADVDAGIVTNTATASATAPDGTTPTSEPSSAKVTIDAAPAVTLTKTADLTSVDATNQTITYTYTVENTGNVTLHGFTFDEQFNGDQPLDPPTCPADVSSLAPGTQMTCTAKYTVDLADMNNGTDIVNTATVTGTAPDNTTTVSSTKQTATVTIAQKPELDILKTAAGGNSGVTYTYTVTNNGNVTITGVGIDDTGTYTDASHVGFSGAGTLPTPTCKDTTLDPGASTTCTASYTPTQADIDSGTLLNTANATGTDPGNTTVTSDQPSNATVTFTRSPSVSLQKGYATPPKPAAANDTVQFTFTITNTGNVTLDATSAVIDDKMTGLQTPVCDISMGTLAPGATMTCTADYTLTQTDVDAGLVNNLNATATLATVYNSTVSATSATSAPAGTSIPLQTSSSMTVDKTTTSAPTKANDTIVYNYLVTNTGTTTIHDVAIDETTFTGTGTLGTPTCTDDTLAPGATTNCSLTYTVTQADVDAGSVSNTAKATATDSRQQSVSSDTSTAPVTIPQTAELDLTKTATPATVTAPDTHVDFAYEITNNGNVTVNDLAIDETNFSGTGMLGTPACSPTPLGGALVPGKTTTCHIDYIVTQADADAGTVTNTATATGTAPDKTPVTSTPSEADVTVNAPASLTVDKEAVRESLRPDAKLALGQVITYEFTVTNTGQLTINNVAIVDPLVTNATCPAGSLAPGQPVVCTGSYTVTQADINLGHITNTAHATGTTTGGNAVDSPPDSTTVPGVIEPSILTYKTHTALPATPPQAGDTVDFTITATNNGNVTLNNVIVGDSRTGDPTCDKTTLAPGETATCDVVYTLTQQDIDAGGLINTATAVGTPDSGDNATDSAVDTVSLAADPSLTLTKSVGQAFLATPGDINYTMTVMNTGNVTLNPLTVTDPGPAGGTGTMSPVKCDATSLAPKASTTCSATYTASQADVDSGATLVNSATATGTAPSGTTVSDTASAPLTVVATHHLTLTKQAGVASVSNPGVIHYTFTVKNDGGTTIASIAVTDAGPAGGTGQMSPVTCDSTELIPGESTNCAADYQVSQADIDAGADLVNTATVTGIDPSSPTVRTISDPALATVTIDQSPSVEMNKTADTTTISAPGVINYTYAVHNTGDVTLTDINIVEGNFTGTGTVSTPLCPVVSLAPDETANCTATYTVSQADIDAGTAIVNTATATANASGADVTSTDSTATTDVTQTPSIELSKTGTLNGSTIHYVYTVHNTGNVTLSAITIAETTFTGHGTLPAPTCPATTLAPDQTITCTADYQLAAGDAGTSIVNDATATGTTPGGDSANPSRAQATVTSPQAEATVAVPGMTVQTGAITAPADYGWAWALLMALASLAMGALALRRRFA